MGTETEITRDNITNNNKISTMWESPAKNHLGQPFIAVKSWNNSYYFSERAGTDSVAFVLYDDHTNEIGLVSEFKPPIDKFLTTAFGGSLDQEGVEPIDIVIQEVREEAGFEVTRNQIVSLGKVFVSTQSNQFCHLFLVNVNKTKQVELRPENDLEALAEVVWLNTLKDIEDWKALTIIFKHEYYSFQDFQDFK